MALENIPQAEVTENVSVESAVEPQQTEVSVEETAPIEQVPQDGPIKIKQSSLDAFTAKVKSNPDYDVFDAKADYPEVNFDDELFDAFAKYANTVIENKYTRETLNKKFTSSYGFEIDAEPPLGKQSPREATVGQSGVIESQSKESKPTEPIVVEPTKAQQIVGGSAEQVALELAEKRVASKETKQGLPQGYVKKDGIVIPDEKTRTDFRIYEGSALNYKQAQDSQGKNFKKIPGVGMLPQIPTEDDVKSLKNKERQSEVYSKKIAPKVQELADLITEGDGYFQFLELKKDDKGQIKSYTLNPYQANEIASKYATSYGLPSNGYFSKFLENQILSAAEYKYKEGKAEPFFKQYELPKLEKKYPEAFSETAMLNTFLSWSKKDDAVFAEQKQKIENVANELSLLKDAELTPIAETYKSDADVLIDADSKEYELLKVKLAELQNQVNAGFDLAQAQAIESQYKEEYAQKQLATKEQLTSLWGNFSDAQNQISGKYQRRLDRHVKESQAFIQSELTGELKAFAKGIYENPRFIADFKAARQRAFAATGLEKMTYEQNIERGYTVADAFIKSTDKTLGASLEAYGSMFGADWMRLYGKQVAAQTIISPAKMDEWSDALNLFNAAKLTGQLAGVMLPSIGAGVAASYLTGGLGLPSIVQGAISLGAGSLASYTVNSFDVANRMYVDEFNKDGNVASALKKSKKMFDFEMGEYEFHLFDALPYNNVFGFRNPLIRGAVLGGVSFLTENVQEQRESLAEEAIRGNVDPYLHIGRSIDNVGKVLKNKFGQYEFLSKAERDEAVKSYRNFKSVSISTSPMFFGAGISGYGQAKNDAYKRDRASEEGVRLFQEHIINEKSDYKALRQQLGTIAMEKGVAFATMIANTMYQKAQIQTKDQYTSVLNSIKAADELIKSPTIQKMKRADRSIYLTLADAYQRSVINSETETDPIQKEAIQKQLKEIKDEMEMFATTKKTNTIQLTLNDGTIYFFLPSELNQALSESNELIEFITNGMATISALNTELTPKQKEIFANISEQINQYEASKAPVVPGTVAEDVELTKEEKDNIKKVEIPNFASYEDALSFIQERAIVYGSEANFQASEEYAELFPVIKDLYDTEQEIRTATTPEEALKIVEQKGLKPGDKVTLETTNFQGKPITLSGTVAVLNGSPIINLDSNQSTMSGEVVVRINNNWKKSEENAVQEQAAGKVPVQPKSEVSGEMAQGKPQAEPQITAEEGQAEAKPEKEKVTVTRASDEEMSAGNQEMDSANVGETITTTKPSRIYKGTFGKRNPDGSIRSAHPNVKGSFGSTNKAIATKYKGNEPFKAFDIPAGTTIEIIKSDKFGEGISIARQDETDRINNSTAQIVRLDTTDNGGRQSQYIIKDKTLIDNGYLVDEEVVSEEAEVAPETEAQAEQATTEEKASKAKQTRLDNLGKALRRKLGIPLGGSVPIYVNINNIDSVIRMVERSGAEQLTKILKDAKKIIIATGKNNTSVVIHNNQSSYTASVLNLGGQAQQSLSNGFFIDRNGNSIHINLPTLQANKANETVLHEGAHPLLEYLIQTDPNAIENLYKQLEALEKDMPEVKRALDFGREYADPIVSKKEAIVQFLALTANGDIKLDELPQTTIDKILNFVKNLLATLGINFEMEINTADDLITIAQKFTFAVENARQIIKDNKISQSPQNNPSFSTVDPNFVTRDGTKIGFKYDRDSVARERFNIDNLERISSGSDRVVFDLGNGMVVKIAKTPRGLAQNIYEGDYYLSERGVIPEIYERGLNYNVVQKVDSPKANKQISEMLREFQRFTQKDFDNKTPKIQEVLEKYGFDEVLNYDILWNDFTRRVNWGVASDGRPIHLDGGTFGGVKMIEQYKGVKAMSDEDFRDVYLKSKEAKRALGETKSKYPQFSIAGVKAELAQDVRDNLQVARDMEAANKDAKSIRIATGWEKGGDGLWRYEILDGQLKGTAKKDTENGYSSNFEQKLEFVLDNEELFNLYPQLRKVNVEFLSDGNWGTFSKSENKITVSSDAKYKKSILLHEIQHAIQNIEGFAIGTNPKTSKSSYKQYLLDGNKTTDSELNSLVTKLAKLKDEFDKKSENAKVKFDEDKVNKYNQLKDEYQSLRNQAYANYNNQGKYNEFIKKSWDVLKESTKVYTSSFKLDNNPDLAEIAKTQSDINKKIDEKLSTLNSYELYEYFGGEVEARNVQKRMDMTPEQRRETLLTETEDVARESQIFLREGDMATGPQFSISATINGQQVQLTPLPEGLEIINGFYSPIERRLAETKTDKQSATKWLTSGIIGKGDEAIYTGVKAWLESKKPQEQVFKSEIQQWMKDNRIIVSEVVGSELEGNLPKSPMRSKITSLQLEGEKENYKEVLVTMPAKTEKANYEVVKKGDLYYPTDKVRNIPTSPYPTFEQAKTEADRLNKGAVERTSKDTFKSTHFDEPNILVHLRMNTRTDADGNEVLFLEEIQSDWGQKGKKEGFSNEKQLNTLKEERKKILDKTWNEGPESITPEEQAKFESLEREINKLLRANVAPAPFVTDTNAWTKLGLKFALKEAVAQGADKIAWTTGEQQNERYDLRKQVDEIYYAKAKDGAYRVWAKKDGDIIFKENSMQEKELEQNFGKDVAEKIINDEGQSQEGLAGKKLSGNDLAVGGKGMKGFYGSTTEGSLGIVGNVAKSLFKQEPKVIDLSSQRSAFRMWDKKTNEFLGSFDGEYTLIDKDGNQSKKMPENYKTAKQVASELGYNINDVTVIYTGETVDNLGTREQNSIDVTPELKAEVQQGLPQFSKASNVENKLIEFIEEQRNQGQSDEDIIEALQNEGYGDTAIEKAFAGISMAPSGIKPKKRKGKEEGTKINEVWERLAKTYEEEGNAEAAEYIRTNGRYGVRKQRDVYDIARRIFFDQNNKSFEMSLRQIEEERFPDDLKVALYGVALENEVAKNPSFKRSKAISDLMKGFAKLGTNYGQAVSMYQYVYQRVPELFYEAKEAEHIKKVYAKIGNPDAVGTTGNKIKRKAVPKIKAIRKEALSSISAALNGLLPVEALFDPKNRYFLSDNKMLDSLKVLLDYGQQLDDTEKTMLKNMVAKMVEGEWAETEADARRIIKANLNDLNGKLRTPFTSDEINTLTSEMITMFLNIAFKGVKTKNEKAFKSKKDIFNQIANVIAEKSDAVILLGNNKEGVPSLTGRMKRGLSILLGKTAEDKTVLSEMMKRLVDGGFVEKARTKAEAEEFIRQELESRNPELQTPLSDTELDEMAAAFVDLYEEIATERIKDALDNILKPPATKQKKTKRDKVVQAVLYGVLDDVDAFNKFAQMFGVATITSQQQDELRQAAEDVQNAKTQGATAYNQALSNFNSTFANIQLQGKVGMAKVLGTIGKGGWFVESVIYNNILSSINTLLRAGTGNVQKVLREFGYAAIKGDIDVIKKAFQESINKSTYNQVPIIDQSGRTIYVDVDLNQFFDNLYSSLRGLPRLSEVKRSGLNETELKIRLMNSGTKKNLVRFFTTPASRSLSAIDSASTPFVELLTKRQLYMAVLKQAYKDADIYKTRLELMGMVDELLEPSNEEIEKAIAKAREDVINGPLYKQLGMTSFPDVDPRLKSKKFSKESKVYNEFIQRIYEILDEESVQRAANVAERYQWDSMFDVGNVIQEIDDLSSKTASEITYLGQPRGTFGGFAQTLANISNKAPVLKYFGITPMFTNASMNAASYLIKLTPGINAIQYVSYQIKGQRGLFKNPKALFDKSLRQQDYINKPILTYDQKKMRDNVIFTNALAVALIAMLTGDDEEKRRKWKEGKGTGFTPIVLSEAQKSLGLKPGVFYYNGEPMVEYKDSAFQPFYAAVAFITNSVIDDVFSTDPFSRQPFQTETRTPEDEDFLEMMANYSLFTMLTAAESSTLKAISETVTDIMKIISTPEEKSTAEVDKVRKEEYGKLFAKKGANFLSMFIPYKRLGGEANSIVSAMMGKNKKKSIEWQDQIFKNTMLERWMLQSEQTDYYGRPIKETFRFVNPFFFLVQIGDEFSGTNYERPEDYGYGDKYLMLLGRQNYSPRSSIGDIVPFKYNRTEYINSFPDDAPRTSREMSQAEREQIDADISSADGSSVTYQEFMENKEKEFAAGDKRIFGIENVDDETILINYKLEPQEAYLINRKKGEFVYDVVSYEETNELGEKLSNFEVLKDLKPLKFRRIMDNLYQLGRNVAIRNNIRDFTLTRQDEFDLRIMTSLFSLQTEFGALGLLWPEKLKLDNLLIDRTAGIENGVLGGEFKFK